ncbi:MAG: type II toxin-antitoxin system VapB family antitoxin [Nitrospinaceae bacterium]|nr:type II toxin-antitoxin system VapB family antitoxin [Nitrospinaceae bacterium]NIR54563.1 type II toxin-antitoxin system VapB family antitoxin [Nitrospinaceae bacterium]NIS84982.1 type II toxin-antitoxin system VapB family antitoxin [Nitrospinaceae bacterium]NIT81793.1 type II toxin-antitoxin system VapB family antitoxin [Nitrospinaceae bacterium]NIU46283.1 type II toxin-antitoxin system VapB family antitoxin [Nitrospinaceae bacterium]
MSRTNIELDERLVKEGLRLTRKTTKKDLVNHALRELVRRLKRKQLLELEGKVKWSGRLKDLRKSRT